MLESVLRHGGPTHAARLARRGRTLILAYHNVVPDDAAATGDRSLHLSRSQFATQLDVLQETCDVVPLDAALEDASPWGGRRPQIVITFDDAYRGAVTLGVAELARRRLPATVFVAPGFIGGGSFWWDVLTPPGAAAPAVARDRALDDLRGEDAVIRQWASGAGLVEQIPPIHATVASEDELRTALQHDSLTLGSHSWSHANLSRLTEPELHEDLTRSFEWLRQRFRAFVPWIAYPYGLSSPVVERTAAACGYRGGLSVTGGWVPAAARAFSRPRFNVPSGLSVDGFVWRTAAVSWP